MMNVELQYQDSTGNWRIGGSVPNNPAMIRQAFQNMKMQYNNARVRAVDANGNVVDIM